MLITRELLLEKAKSCGDSVCFHPGSLFGSFIFSVYGRVFSHLSSNGFSIV